MKECRCGNTHGYAVVRCRCGDLFVDAKEDRPLMWKGEDELDRLADLAEGKSAPDTVSELRAALEAAEQNYSLLLHDYHAAQEELSKARERAEQAENEFTLWQEKYADLEEELRRTRQGWDGWQANALKAEEEVLRVQHDYLVLADERNRLEAERDALKAQVEAARRAWSESEDRAKHWNDMWASVDSELSELRRVAAQYLDTGRGDLDGVLARLDQRETPRMLTGKPSQASKHDRDTAAIDQRETE